MVVVATPALAAAQTSAEASLRVYQDDDAVRVWSPGARVQTTLGERLTIELDTSIDALSAASVDVTSQASPRGFEETRVEGGARASLAFGATRSVSVEVVGSTENDYDALRVGLGTRVELARRNATLDARWTGSFDVVGRAGDPSFARDRRGQRLVLTFTHIVDPRMYLDVAVDGELTWGYLASPYRYVPVTGPADPEGAPLYQLPEAVPGRRAALATLARVRRALGRRWFAHVEYRLYGDSWGVWSHTGTGALALALADDHVVLGLQGRVYWQGAASFYEAHVVDDGGGAPAWRTRDRAFGGMRSVAASLAADWWPGDGAVTSAPRLTLAVTLVRFTWLDFPLQRGRDAVITSAALVVPF
jgi:hypothetical protein